MPGELIKKNQQIKQHFSVQIVRYRFRMIPVHFYGIYPAQVVYIKNFNITRQIYVSFLKYLNGSYISSSNDSLTP